MLERREQQDRRKWYEHRLTEKGADLYTINPAVVAWGDRGMSAKIVPKSNKGRKENIEYRTRNRRMSKEILELRHSAFGVRYSIFALS